MKKKESNDKDSYNQFKEFHGQKYTGVKIGRGHSWHYDQGDWKEKKITPDLWEFHYNVNKHRAGHAPEGSGVPVDTEYHWYILAHQNVRKLDANTYSTAMRGYKYKLAHKRADKEKWSTNYAGQRKRLKKLLQSVIEQIEKEEKEEKAQKKNKPKRKATVEKTNKSKSSLSSRR